MNIQIEQHGGDRYFAKLRTRGSVYLWADFFSADDARRWAEAHFDEAVALQDWPGGVSAFETRRSILAKLLSRVRRHSTAPAVPAQPDAGKISPSTINSQPSNQPMIALTESAAPSATGNQCQRRVVFEPLTPEPPN